MGSFYSSIQIQNRQHLSQQAFLEAFSKKMKERGYEVTTQEEGEQLYGLRFSEKSDWVAYGILQEDNRTNDIRTEAGWIAKTFQTCCIVVEMVDSDFATLELYDKKEECVDMAIVSDASGYGFEEEDTPRGEEACWQPLLEEGRTWDELAAIWCDETAMADDSLVEMAPLLGMDEANLLFDVEYAEKEENTVFLQIKKVEA